MPPSRAGMMMSNTGPPPSLSVVNATPNAT
jgi:hypothetical protein